MQVAIAGLGRMGAGMARRAARGGHDVVVWNRTEAVASEVAAEEENQGRVSVAEPIDRLVELMTAPRHVVISVPSGAATDAMIEQLGPYTLISDGSELPVFAFAVKDPNSAYSVYDVSDALRTRGWIVPAYKMPPAIDDLSVLRVCVRNGFSRDLAEIFLDDLARKTERVERGWGEMPDEERQGFHH